MNRKNETKISTPPRIAFIAAQWHADIVAQCRAGFADEFERLGYGPETVDDFTVPGSFDIPLLAKKLAEAEKYDAVVAAGLIVDGGIYRHEFVSNAVIDGLMRVQLDTGTPVVSAVLTPHQFQEHEPHVQFFKKHFVIKGAEAARACAAVVDNLRKLERRDELAA